MSSAVRAEIVAAISSGAPLYNSGKPDACCDLYRACAERLLLSDQLLPIEADILREAVAAAGSLKVPTEAAWALRHAFDSILDGTAAARAQLSSLPAGASDFTLLDFQPGLPDVPRWLALDDEVMGGVSSSSMSWSAEEQAALFLGSVTTEYNGGFASVRSQPWGGWTMLERASGIKMMVKGDGRRYKLNAKRDDMFDGIQYQHDFDTRSGEWQEVHLPFERFKPNFRGQVVSSRPALQGSQVRQLGLMVSKFSDGGGFVPGFRSGSFRLAIKWIKGII